MLIVCPACATSYQVENSILGAGGRSVRCVRCRNIWFAGGTTDAAAPDAKPAPADAVAGDEAVKAFKAELSSDPSAAPDAPPDETNAPPLAAEGVPENAPPATAEPQSGAADEPPPGPSLDELIASSAPQNAASSETDGSADAITTEQPLAAESDPQSPLSLAEITIPVSGTPPLAPDQPSRPDPVTLQNAREDIETAARRRRLRNAERAAGRRTLRNGLPLLILALVAGVAALIAWRAAIVRHVPQTASFYEAIRLPVNLRGLKFAEVKIGRDTHDGVPVLVVEGQIVSVAPAPVEVPRLRFAIRNAAGGEVYSWTAVPTQSTLPPGETLPFPRRLGAPPDGPLQVVVRFFSRRDAVAGLH